MTAKPSLFPSVGRVLVYGVLLLAAAFFLLPLYAMLVTSFKDAEEIRTTSLLALPGGLNWSAWSTAWSSACTGVDCNGLRPFFWNSVTMAVPAVLISTLWGALNGYVLSLWKFRGSDVLFGLLLFGVFMPFQVVLLPMSQVLGMLGLSSSITGLVLVHCLAGLAGTTLFFRNYYAAIPKELVNAARMDGANFWQIFWRIVLPLSTPIFMVTLIWQFTNIWNDFLFGVVFSGTEAKPITVGLNNLANTSSSVKAYNVDMAAAIIAGLPTMAIYVLAGKFFVRGLTAGAVKGSEGKGRSWRHHSKLQASTSALATAIKAWRFCAAWTSTSRRASSSSWWAPRAAANPLCSTSLRVWTTRPKVRCALAARTWWACPRATATLPWCSRATRCTPP